MCEDLVADLHCREFPVAILRPSIIGAIARAPVPGYFGNAAGLTSATLAFATGAPFLQSSTHVLRPKLLARASPLGCVFCGQKAAFTAAGPAIICLSTAACNGI